MRAFDVVGEDFELGLGVDRGLPADTLGLGFGVGDDLLGILQRVALLALIAPVSGQATVANARSGSTPLESA